MAMEEADPAAAGVGMRISALGSSLDQLRLSLLAALERTAERVDRPAWLAELQVAVDRLAARHPADDELRRSLTELTTKIEQAVAEPSARLAGIEAALSALGPLDDELRRGLDDLRTTIETAATASGERAGTSGAGEPAAAGEAARRAEAAVVAVGERVAELSSTLEQLRLSLLAGLDRTIDRFDRPPWLPELQASLAQDRRLDDLVETVTSLGDGVRASAAIADALEGVGERLGAFEASAEQVARNVRALEERVAPLPDRLTAVASQVDRITPLARAGDEAGSLLGQLDRVSEGLAEVAAHISANGSALEGRAPAAGGDGEGEVGRIDAMVEALAAVSRRQDEVTTAVKAVLDQVRGPMGVDAVLDRMEQRERSLVARLDRIDIELRRRGEQPATSSAEARPKPDESATALRAALDRLDQQERAVAVQLERVGQRLAEVAARPEPDHGRPEAAPPDAAAAAANQSASVVAVLAEISRRQDDLAAALDRRLSAIETRLQDAADEPRPPPRPSASAEAAARRLAELRAERVRVQAHLRDERLLASRSWPEEDLGDEV